MPDVLVNADLTGTDRSCGVRGVFVGADGLRALSQQHAFSAVTPERFRAEMITTDYEGVLVERFRCTPCRVAPHRDAGDLPAGLRISLVSEGAIAVQHDGQRYDAASGDLLVARTSSPFDLTAEVPFQLASLTVPADRLPARLLAGPAAPIGRLPPTRLTASVGAFLQRLAAGPASAGGPDRVYLARAVAELAVAVLVEAAGDELPDDRADALRARVREFIDRNLGDQDLGPRRIAAELEVSVRYVHRVFNVGDETVAKYIRERRLDAVARTLRAERRTPRVGALAERFGFSGRDHLTRAFRQRYGVTLREYHEQAAERADAVLAGTRLPV